ncbi:hypothetical protein AUI46_01010 [archaeon 13_1_40CM_2_52_13]|nr:MAG: hypothetical protein AUI46_01010 [archaeon 13_1_40CM_2_52_13]TMI40644.1 MAG: hypothetical protein E6H21_05910 [Candidatus Bathyarchaeota archaeon]
MPVKIIHPHHTEVVGTGLVLLSSRPVTGAKRDIYTGQIVEETALLSKSWAIIAKESKHVQDGEEGESANSDWEKSVRDFVDEYRIKCMIVIGGTAEPGITVKSKLDGSESEEVLDLIKSGLEPHFAVTAVVDQSRNGLSGSRSNDGGAVRSLTHSVHVIQIDLGPEERSFWKDQIVNSVADIVGLINAKLGFSESSSGALD